ncbi:MAG: alpha/beta fold hydrolase [Bdellovibrionales bacterium]
MKNLENTTHFFESTDKLRKIFYQRRVDKSQESKATLVITHGLGEHSEAYTHISKSITSNLPVDVISWDMTGHGKSSGQRGYVGDIHWLIKDLIQLLNILNLNAPSRPLFLLSHSLGGLVTLSAEQLGLLKDLNIKGLILSNPCTKLNFTPPRWKTAGAEALAKLLPRATLGNEISPEQLSTDPEYLEIYKADPVRHSKISPRLFLGMVDLINDLKEQVTKTPTLALISTKDPICDAQNALKLLRGRSKIVSFDHSMHEVLNDIEKETAIARIKEFLNENI